MIVAFSCSGSEGKSTKPELDAAGEFVAESKWAAAEKSFIESLTRNPNDAAALAGLGLCKYMQNPKQLETEDLMKRALAADPNEAKIFFYRGLLDWQQKNLQKATEDFTKAASLDPHFSPPFLFRGLLEEREGDYKSALKDFTQAIQEGTVSGKSEALLARARANFQLSRYKETLKDLWSLPLTESNSHDTDFKDYAQMASTLVTKFPNSDIAFFVRGRMLLLANQTSSAIADFDEALTLNPKNDRAYALRGEAFLKSRKLKEGLKDIETSIRINPTESYFYWLKGIAQISEPKLAVASFSKSTNLDSTNCDAFLDLGMSYFRDGDFSLAEDTFAKTLERCPSSATAHYLLACTLNSENKLVAAQRSYSEAKFIDPNVAVKRAIRYSNLGFPQEQIAEYSRAISLDPKNFMLLMNRSNLFRLQGQFDNAIKDCNSAIALGPNMSFAYANRGLCYEALNQTDRAISDFTQAIKLQEKQPIGMFYIHRGRLYLRLSQFDKALNDANQTLKITPNDSEAFALIASVQVKKGTIETGIRSYSKAIEYSKQANANLYLERSRAYSSIGKYQEAADDCTQALKLDPQNTKALEQRALAYKGLKQPEKAQADLKEADLNRSKFENGIRYLQSKQYQNAIDAFSQAIEKSPNDLSTYLHRSQAYKAIGSHKNAIDDLTKVIDLNGKTQANISFYVERFQEYVILGDYNKALEDLSRIITLAPYLLLLAIVPATISFLIIGRLMKNMQTKNRAPSTKHDSI